MVWTSPRSGSSWLVDLLDSHPRVAAYGELFLPGDRSPLEYGRRDIPRFEVGAPPRRLTRVPARISYLNRLYAPRTGIDAVGFKLMYGHPRAHRGLLPFLTVRHVRAVHLVRTNTLAQVVSLETALARSSFRAHEGEEIGSVRIRVEPAGLVARLARMEAAVTRGRTLLRRRRIATFELTYESLLGATRDELERVVAFLGVRPAAWEPASSLLRLNPGPLVDLVENADELESALAGSPYAWMLERPRVPA